VLAQPNTLQDPSKVKVRQGADETDECAGPFKPGTAAPDAMPPSKWLALTVRERWIVTIIGPFHARLCPVIKDIGIGQEFLVKARRSQPTF
jgi:hypothetical protein